MEGTCIVCNIVYTCIDYHLGSTVDVFMDEKNVFTGLHFQDKLMKYYESYPKVLMVNATYQLDN